MDGSDAAQWIVWWEASLFSTIYMLGYLDFYPFTIFLFAFVVYFLNCSGDISDNSSIFSDGSNYYWGILVGILRVLTRFSLWYTLLLSVFCFFPKVRLLFVSSFFSFAFTLDLTEVPFGFHLVRFCGFLRAQRCSPDLRTIGGDLSFLSLVFNDLPSFLGPLVEVILLTSPYP